MCGIDVVMGVVMVNVDPGIVGALTGHLFGASARIAPANVETCARAVLVFLHWDCLLCSNFAKSTYVSRLVLVLSMK